MDIKNTEVVKKIEKLDPFKIKANKLNNNKVALIIGIENYARSPDATYANLDAKYFYEYVKNGVLLSVLANEYLENLQHLLYSQN